MYRASNDDLGTTAEKESANELELGLSLGRVVRSFAMAEDFHVLISHDSPVPSNSSVSSSSGLGDEVDGDAAGRCFKRADAFSYNGARLSNLPSHNQVVGWPPIRTCRRNSLSRITISDVKAATHKESSQSCSSNAKKNGNGGNDGESATLYAQKSPFVKVNMDGDPIGRKVDLHAHVSYEALAKALKGMFYKPTLSINVSTDGMTSKLLDDPSEYVLTYEDDDGDWMLVGDVPWGMFLHTAIRLRIMRAADACGLWP